MLPKVRHSVNMTITASQKALAPDLNFSKFYPPVNKSLYNLDANRTAAFLCETWE